MPIFAEGRIILLLNVEHSQENAFSPEEVEALRILLNDAGSLFNRIREDNRNAAALRSTPSAVFVVDRAGLIRRANPAAEKLLNYSGGLEGQKFVALFADQALGEAFLESDGASWTVEAVLRKQSGLLVPVLMGANQLGPGFDNEVIVAAKGLEGYIRSEQTKFLGQMYYELATQYKTPLTLAFFWVQKLNQASGASREKELASKVLGQLRKIELTLDRLAMFDNTKSPMFHPCVLNLKGLIADIINELPSNETERIMFSAEPNNEEVEILGDAFQLSFVFRTIVSYYIRNLPADPTINISIYLEIEPNSVDVTLSGPWAKPAPSRFHRRHSDEAALRSVWELALGNDLIATFLGNHDAVFGQTYPSDGFTEYRLKFKRDLRRQK